MGAGATRHLESVQWMELQCFCGTFFNSSNGHIAGCTRGGRACKGCQIKFQDPRKLNTHKLLCPQLVYSPGERHSQGRVGCGIVDLGKASKLGILEHAATLHAKPGVDLELSGLIGTGEKKARKNKAQGKKRARATKHKPKEPIAKIDAVGNVHNAATRNVIDIDRMLDPANMTTKPGATASSVDASTSNASNGNTGLLDASALQSSKFVFTCDCLKMFAKQSPFLYHKQRCKQKMARSKGKEEGDGNLANAKKLWQQAREHKKGLKHGQGPGQFSTVSITAATTTTNEEPAKVGQTGRNRREGSEGNGLLLGSVCARNPGCHKPNKHTGRCKSQGPTTTSMVVHAATLPVHVERPRLDLQRTPTSIFNKSRPTVSKYSVPADVTQCVVVGQTVVYTEAILAQVNTQHAEQMHPAYAFQQQQQRRHVLSHHESHDQNPPAVDLFDSGSALHSNDIAEDDWNTYTYDQHGVKTGRLHMTIDNQTPHDIAVMYNVRVDAILELSATLHPRLRRDSKLMANTAVYVPLSANADGGDGRGGNLFNNATAMLHVKQELVDAVFASPAPFQHPPHSPVTVRLSEIDEWKTALPPTPHSFAPASQFDCTSPIPKLSSEEILQMDRTADHDPATPTTVSASMMAMSPQASVPAPAYLTPTVASETTATIGFRKQKLFQSPGLSATELRSADGLVKPQPNTVYYTSENGKKKSSVISRGYALVPIVAAPVLTFAGCCPRSKSRSEHLKCANCNKCRRGCCMCNVDESDAPKVLAWTF